MATRLASPMSNIDLIVVIVLSLGFIAMLIVLGFDDE